MLKVNDLHAYYGKSHILQGVNFDVKEGEIVSLLGRNGVGRSTTCKAIMGDVEPQGPQHRVPLVPGGRDPLDDHAAAVGVLVGPPLDEQEHAERDDRAGCLA